MLVFEGVAYTELLHTVSPLVVDEPSPTTIRLDRRDDADESRGLEGEGGGVPTPCSVVTAESGDHTSPRLEVALRRSRRVSLTVRRVLDVAPEAGGA